MKDISWEQLDKTKYFVYGSVLLAGTRVVAYPQHLIKTRLQTGTVLTQKTTALRMLSQIFKTEGPNGLFRGLAVVLFGLIPSQAVQYSSYEYVKSYIKQACDKLSQKEYMINQIVTQTSAAVITLPSMVEPRFGLLRSEVFKDISSNLVAGSMSSLASQIIVVPTDVVSQRVIHQTGQSQKQKVSGREVVRSIINNEGIRGLYKGFGTSSVTYSLGSSIWWVAYSLVKRQMPSNGSLTQDVIYQSVAGGAAGIFSTILTHPLDLIKTNMQVQVKNVSFLQTAKRILIKEGWLRMFTSGLAARLSNSVPISMMVVIAYETAKQLSVNE